MSELEFFGRCIGMESDPSVGGVDTNMSEKRKNCERREMYNFTTSSAMLRHCEGLRSEEVLPSYRSFDEKW